MKVEFHQSFIKSFKKRYPPNSKIRKKFFRQTAIFEKNPRYSSLKNHALKGKRLGLRAFSVTENIRVIYFIKNNIAYFVDIGTHNQVYK